MCLRFKQQVFEADPNSSRHHIRIRRPHKADLCFFTDLWYNSDSYYTSAAWHPPEGSCPKDRNNSGSYYTSAAWHPPEGRVQFKGKVTPYDLQRSRSNDYAIYQ